MINRIFKKWTFIRVVYFILGAFIIVQAIILKQYFGVILGSYFASMGLFAFGCAAGNCNFLDSPAKIKGNFDKG